MRRSLSEGNLPLQEDKEENEKEAPSIEKKVEIEGFIDYFWRKSISFYV